jgi:hypothetical protein
MACFSLAYTVVVFFTFIYLFYFSFLFHFSSSAETSFLPMQEQTACIGRPEV